MHQSENDGIFHMLSHALIMLSASLTQLTGASTVTDGDTIRIGEDRIRLEGIDAPESQQMCKRADGSDWSCGKAATDALRGLIGAQSVRCDISGKDRYNRSLGTCWLGAVNLNQWMVASGWAVAYMRYSDQYQSDERAARQSKKNLWSSEFEMPWDWRVANRR